LVGGAAVKEYNRPRVGSLWITVEDIVGWKNANEAVVIFDGTVMLVCSADNEDDGYMKVVVDSGCTKSVCVDYFTTRWMEPLS
jgi:hypothetical protein